MARDIQRFGLDDLTDEIDDFVDSVDDKVDDLVDDVSDAVDDVIDTIRASRSDVSDIARLYEAAFDRQADTGGLNFWIDTFETGLSLFQIATSFMQSSEFDTLYGIAEDLSDNDYLNSLYQNVLDRSGDAGGLAYWSEQLSSGLDRANVLISFAESAENIAGTSYLSNLSETTDGLWSF